MAPAVVYLHIGSPKTGTTYLQDSLWDNREALADAGILLPGRSRVVISKLIVELLKWRRADGDLPRGWRRLCDEVNAWSGQTAVISHEHLHRASEAQWAAIVASFPDSRVEVVLTARDLARSVPAQWQSSVRQRFTWTLGEYADDIVATPAGTQTAGPAYHFWTRQDSPAILRRFIARIPADRVRLVTVPPSGGDPDELWWRFVRACDLGAAQTTPGTVSHESLGAASAEVIRRLNGVASVKALTSIDYKKTINHALSRHTLALRRGEEHGLTLPDRYRDWAENESARVIKGIEETGVEVIGDLDDLRPRPSSRPFVSPEDQPDGELLEAALAGLTGLALQHVELRAQVSEMAAALAAAEASADAAEDPTASDEEVRPGVAGMVRRRLQRGS